MVSKDYPVKPTFDQRAEIRSKGMNMDIEDLRKLCHYYSMPLFVDNIGALSFTRHGGMYYYADAIPVIEPVETV